MVLLPPWIGILGVIQRDVSYGITNTWDEMLVDMKGAPATDDIELGRRITEFATRDRHAHARTALLMEREARIVAGSGPQEIGGDYIVASSRPQESGIVH
ncbi:hypothetical protein Tco_0306214 [Tanacetum coccineum]